MWLAPQHTCDSLIWRLILLQKRSLVTCWGSSIHRTWRRELYFFSLSTLLIWWPARRKQAVECSCASEARSRETSAEQCELGVRGSLECTMGPLCEFLQARRDVLYTMPTLWGLDEHPAPSVWELHEFTNPQVHKQHPDSLPHETYSYIFPLQQYFYFYSYI